MGSLYPEPRDRPTHPTGTAQQRGRRSPDRRPRAGSAGVGGRHGVPGRRVRGAGRERRRPRRQHQPDRLPGGLHRPLVRGPGRGDDLPADRQLRPPGRRRPVDPAVAPGAGRGQRDRGGPRRRPPARGAPPRQRHPGHRRGRHAGPRPAPAGQRLPARDRHRPRRDRSGRGGRRGAGRRPVGGPGLRRPGLAVVDHGHRASGGRWSADRDRGLRAQVEHRPRDATPRGPGARPAAHDLGLRRPRPRHRRPDPVARPRGSGPPRRTRGAGEGDHRRRPAAARDLPRSPDRRPGRGRRDDAAPVRPPRREPPGPRPRARAGPGHGPEPRGPGRRRRRSRSGPASGSARSTSTTGPWRASATARRRSRPSSTTPRAHRGRSTRWPCSTGSWPPHRPSPFDDRGVREAGLGPDHRVGAGRHRPGGRVRLRRARRPAARCGPRACARSWSTRTRPRS